MFLSIESIRALLDETNLPIHGKLDSIARRIDDHDSRLTRVEEQILELQQAQRESTGACAKDFAPTYVEVKGWCDFT